MSIDPRSASRLPFHGAAFFAALFLSVGYPARSACAQGATETFGTGPQEMTIDASAFRPYQAALGGAFNSSDGYLYATPGSANHYIAPVALPDGAEITLMCLYAYDANPSSTASMQFEAKKLVFFPSASVGRYVVPGTFIRTNFDYGYGVVCTSPLSYIFHTTADVDGTGVQNIAHRIVASIDTTDGSTGFGGVLIDWHRQVSPAPATATFNDIPTSHPFFQFVEAINAAGIMGGCSTNPPRFCPGAQVTRGQLAVFLSRALGLYWPN